MERFKNKIGEGAQGEVYLSNDKKLVLKQYKSNNISGAKEEFDRLEKIYKKLLKAHIEGVSIPKSHSLILENKPSIIMEYCPGLRLDYFLLTNKMSINKIQSISVRLHRFAQLYVETFNEPYWDFCCQNILYHSCKDNLTVIDLNPDELLRNISATKIEATLGMFIGWNIYQVSRPSLLLNLNNYLINLIWISVSIIKEGRDYSLINVDCILHIAKKNFIRLSSNGKMIRKLWYGSIVGLLFWILKRKVRQELL